jgi:ergothioneine biosynthesis protein EgtB
MINKKNIIEMYETARNETVRISQDLETEDFVVQASDFVSPTKWHLAHTTWFFEEFVLSKQEHYKKYNKAYCELFNSYYNSVGKFWNQNSRGILSRPTVKEVFGYRQSVDRDIKLMLSQDISDDTAKIIEIGIQHEQQHQELMRMDLKYNLFQNPMKPVLPSSIKEKIFFQSKNENEFVSYEEEELFEMGRNYGQEFCFDNETPMFKNSVRPFAISSEFILNEDYKEFIESGAISNHDYWFSDGYKLFQEGAQGTPLYWFKKDYEWFEYHIDGVRPLSMKAPVRHISFYEASAFASWKGLRLPSEAEWEFHAKRSKDPELMNNLWQWTASPYQAYPGYEKPRGAIGEYNQKFMLNQIVLKGGCYFTSKGHSRISYRNFFYPEQKWMLSGIRLAKDLL